MFRHHVVFQSLWICDGEPHSKITFKKRSNIPASPTSVSMISHFDSTMETDGARQLSDTTVDYCVCAALKTGCMWLVTNENGDNSVKAAIETTPHDTRVCLFTQTLTFCLKLQFMQSGRIETISCDETLKQTAKRYVKLPSCYKLISNNAILFK